VVTVARRTYPLLVVLALLVAAVGCGDEEDDPGYTAEREAEFLEACEASASEDACRCAWDRIVATVPAERFVEVSEDLGAGGPLPEDLAEIAADCATEAVIGG
jgi:hypothetical protein